MTLFVIRRCLERPCAVVDPSSLATDAAAAGTSNYVRLINLHFFSVFRTRGLSSSARSTPLTPN